MSREYTRSTVRRMAATIGALCTVTLGFAAPAASQTSNGLQASASMNVSARIIQGLFVRGVTDLDFGDIVAPASVTTKEIVKTDPNAGQFEMIGATGQAVQISYVAPTQLVRADGPGTLAIDLTMYGTETPSAVAGASPILPDGSVTMSNGRYVFIVAGRLTVRDAVSNPPGMYTGSFEVSVSYTNI